MVLISIITHVWHALLNVILVSTLRISELPVLKEKYINLEHAELVKASFLIVFNVIKLNVLDAIKQQILSKNR